MANTRIVRQPIWSDDYQLDPFISSRISDEEKYKYLAARNYDHNRIVKILCNPDALRELERGMMIELERPKYVLPPPPPLVPNPSSTKQSDVPDVSAALSSNKKLLLLLE